MKLKKFFGYLAICAIAVVGVVTLQSSTTESASNSGDRFHTFVKTNARCDKCSCSGYWGYRHGNGTYEGACSNTDGSGHTCRHSPEHHGLRSW